MGEAAEAQMDADFDRMFGKAERRARSKELFDESLKVAWDNNIRLQRFSDAHYRVTHADGWELEVYPGNRRIYRRKHSKAPFVELPEDWTILDVVKGVAAIESKEPKQGT